MGKLRNNALQCVLEHHTKRNADCVTAPLAILWAIKVRTGDRAGLWPVVKEQLERPPACYTGRGNFGATVQYDRTQTYSNQPLPNGDQSGRNEKGQFVKGCPGGPGNPNAASVGKNRARLFEIVRTSDIELAVKTMRDVMRSGKDSDRLNAARLLLDRALGPYQAVDIEERLTQLEQLLTEAVQHQSK